MHKRLWACLALCTPHRILKYSGLNVSPWQVVGVILFGNNSLIVRVPHNYSEIVHVLHIEKKNSS